MVKFFPFFQPKANLGTTCKFFGRKIKRRTDPVPGDYNPWNIPVARLVFYDPGNVEMYKIDIGAVSRSIDMLHEMIQTEDTKWVEVLVPNNYKLEYYSVFNGQPTLQKTYYTKREPPIVKDCFTYYQHFAV